MVTRNEPGVRLRFALAVLAPALLVLLPVAGSVNPLGALTAGLAVSTVVAVVAVTLVALVPAATPAQVRTVGLRERSRKAAFLRLRDPDAPGRPRPRAPGVRSTAA